MDFTLILAISAHVKAGLGYWREVGFGFRDIGCFDAPEPNRLTSVGRSPWDSGNQDVSWSLRALTVVRGGASRPPDPTLQGSPDPVP
jgi:hypothetical protein